MHRNIFYFKYKKNYIIYFEDKYNQCNITINKQKYLKFKSLIILNNILYIDIHQQYKFNMNKLYKKNKINFLTK